MSRKLSFRLGLVLVLCVAGLGAWYASAAFQKWLWPASESAPQTTPKVTRVNGARLSATGQLQEPFKERVQPFVERYCVSCHGATKPKSELDLSHDTTTAAVVNNAKRWQLVLQRLEAQEMPPESSAELDYTIRDLTGVDIRPAREFPVDPANEAGFDNSGESLAMSPALLKKYLAAARLVADHVILKPQGFVFAPHPVVTDTDRDKYCVQRIIDFYQRHKVDYAGYFLAAWKYGQRDKLGRPTATLADFAAEAGLSAKYLAMIWSTLTQDGAGETGPLAAIRKRWQEMPESAAAARPACERLRELVVRLRKPLQPEVKKLSVNGISAGSQPLVLWRNRALASRHRNYDGDAVADVKKLGEQLKGADAALQPLLAIEEAAPDKEKLRAGLQRFCDLFPDAFVVSDRGPYFDPKAADKGRPLTAGFHLMQGYFRDDQPLCDLILTDAERAELDGLWQELDFVTLVPLRQYKDFIFFERAEPPRFMFEAEFDFARSEDKDCTSEAKMNRLAEAYLAKARKKGAKGEVEEAIVSYFSGMASEIRGVERARLAAEPSHLEALLTCAERAYRRPLAKAERDDLRAYYQALRKKDELGHEEALRDTLVTVLMSPHFCYRFTVANAGTAAQPLSAYELANRLSYFLWSSMPDAELLKHAAAGDLQQPEILLAQTRRLLRDPKVRGLATEFAGNWLDFRRFEVYNAVDRQRFPTFTNELRQAMFEEPIRYFMDVAQRNRSVLDLLYGTDTFVNPALADHYGVPFKGVGWIHIEDAQSYGRGGMLPMAVFLTKNAPGLRTIPVKRGYWVVRRLLGEQIPPPPPAVPELPKDEANLGDLTLPQLLARHRADKNCAACHRRFDAVGLVFEDFGPIGERRSKDLGGRLVETAATFPDGKERSGLKGLREYLKEKRQDDFVNNLCRKLLSFALGRGLQLSDKKTLDVMRSMLATDGCGLGSLVEEIVRSPQFLNKRGRDDSRGG
jgi:hypothetical protein